ncbi:hypothetical protein [Chryseobacterium aquaticum]|jgi:uncharacterized membrane protein|uniref:hypothetical protein n=1 Tax=Chryseobacterium aquaticum TaxID=452084 RepID=UPI003F6EE7A1
MNLIFAKLYEEYVRKNDPAKFNITLYISIVYFFLIFALLLPVKTFIDNKIFDDQTDYEKSTILTVVFGLLTLITSLVYYIYIKKNYIERLTKRYKTKKINKTILYIIVALTPVTLLLLGATTTVYLNGGEILGHKIQGLLE